MVIYNNPIEFKENVKKYQDHIGALEEERRKIQVFQRELPLCLDLVSQAIERCREEMSETPFDRFGDQQRCRDHLAPVLEEFIPIKPTLSRNEDDNENKQVSKKSNIICSKDSSCSLSKKSDWLTSAQLSIQESNPPIEEDFLSKNMLLKEESRNGCDAFLHIRKKKSCVAPLPSLNCADMIKTASVSSSLDTDGGGSDGGGGGCNDEDKGHSNKKERRCWSSELHRRFLHALQQLGGAYVATPKQIKELMKVEGLTNDEIKSHLQKYRLHTRRLNPTIHNTPQLVVVGRIWMPPLDYTTKAPSSPLTDNANNIKVYAPKGSLPPSIAASPYKTTACKQQLHFVEKGNHRQSNSPSSSSSS
ncbi:transcription factor HHO3-like protein [Tanacetum coccineum]